MIQEVDLYVFVETGLKPIGITVGTRGNLGGIFHYFTATFMATGSLLRPPDNFATHQETRLYSGQNQTPLCDVLLSGFSAAGYQSRQLSGFLVD